MTCQIFTIQKNARYNYKYICVMVTPLGDSLRVTSDDALTLTSVRNMSV